MEKNVKPRKSLDAVMSVITAQEIVRFIPNNFKARQHKNGNSFLLLNFFVEIQVPTYTIAKGLIKTINVFARGGNPPKPKWKKEKKETLPIEPSPTDPIQIIE